LNAKFQVANAKQAGLNIGFHGNVMDLKIRQLNKTLQDAAPFSFINVDDQIMGLDDLDKAHSWKKPRLCLGF
jgi:hypothetical protein